MSISIAETKVYRVPTVSWYYTSNGCVHMYTNNTKTPGSLDSKMHSCPTFPKIVHEPHAFAHTLIFIAIVGCGLYPITSKSSAFHPSIEQPISLLIFKVGKSLGSLSNCTFRAST